MTNPTARPGKAAKSTSKQRRPKRRQKSGVGPRPVDNADAEEAKAKEEEYERNLALAQSASRLFDANVSERLAEYLADSYCWGGETGWRRYHKGKWTDVSEEEVIEIARQRHKEWFTAAFTMAVIDKEGSHKVGALKRLLMDTGINAIVRLCRGQMKTNPGLWDADPHLLNTPTGVVDLDNDGDLLEHSPDYFMTKMTKVGYVPGATHEDWDKVLEAVDPDTLEWAQARFGQALLGEPPDDDAAVFMKGDGDNGKTTLLYGIAKALGDYAVLLADELLLAVASKKDGAEKMELWGARLAYIEELPDDQYLDVALVKKIMSPKLKGRWLYKKPYTFDTTHSLFVSHNPHLRVAETDHGSWRRLIQWPFRTRFVQRRRGYRLKKNEAWGDTKLRRRVLTNPRVQRAALAWAVEGAIKLCNGSTKLRPLPPSVDHATNEWRAGADSVLRFTSQFLRFEHGYHIRTAELVISVNVWLRRNNRPTWDEQTVFSKFLNHELFKQNEVGKKYTKVGTKSSQLSKMPASMIGGDDEMVAMSKTGYQALHGVRFVGPDDDEDEA